MRILPAENRMDLDDLLLPFQRFQIMGHGQEIHFGRQFVGFVAPVAIGEDPELAAPHESRQPGLHVGEVLGRCLGPTGDASGNLRRFRGIALQGAHHVDPVQRVQMVEVNDVILHVLGAEHQVAHQFGVRRHGDPQGVFHGADRGQGMHGRADAAGPLAKSPRIAGIAPLEDLFESAHHRARTVGIDDLPVFHFRLDAQMAFDAGNRVNDNSGSH